MTFKQTIQIYSQKKIRLVRKNMKHLVGKVITKKFPFMGDEVEVRQLSVGEVLKVQNMIKKTSKSKAEDSQTELLRGVIKIAVVGAEDLSNEEFSTFPIAALNELSENILEFSGLSGGTSQGN